LGLGFLLPFKSLNKTFKGGSPAFSRTNLIKALASSAPPPTAGLSLRLFHILPLTWIQCPNPKENLP